MRRVPERPQLLRGGSGLYAWRFSSGGQCGGKGSPLQKDLSAKRPGTGISPMKWFEVLGQKAERDFEEDELIVVEKWI